MSTVHRRYLFDSLSKDLKEKMIFIGGPRQVGKTTFAQNFIKNFIDEHPAYLNWDLKKDRKKIQEMDWPRSEALIVFDEVHKFPRWKNLIKGIYDSLKNTQQFIVTGSARLDHYRKGGDSMLGRYYYYRLHPLSLPELNFEKSALDRLLKYGGFPGPYFKSKDDYHKRWLLQRVEKLVREDVRDLESIRNISLMELLADALPERVGSPLSVRNLAQDLEIDPKTCARWIEILEKLYFCYRISPYGIPKLKTVKVEQKLYLWDWSQVPSEGGFRFENMVAGHLLKYCHFNQDAFGDKMELCYIRDTEKREVDFVVIKNKKPLFAVECKTGEKSVSPHLHYYSERSQIPKFYQVHLGKQTRHVGSKIELLPFEDFCKKVGLV